MTYLQYFQHFLLADRIKSHFLRIVRGPLECQGLPLEFLMKLKNTNSIRGITDTALKGILSSKNTAPGIRVKVPSNNPRPRIGQIS